MIDFQLFDLEKKGIIENIEELEIYAENTRSLLIYLNLNLLGITDEESYICGSHVGRGIGIVDSLKKFPTLLKMNINILPETIVKKHAISNELLFNRYGEKNERLYDIILEIAAYAKKHIDVARSFNLNEEAKKRNVQVAFLQAVEAYYWLDNLEKVNFDIFDPSLTKISQYTVPNLMMTQGKKGLF